MLVQIGVRAPDFHDPLGLLEASLVRLQARLRALAFAGSSLGGRDPEAREQAERGLTEAVEYFELAGEDHFQDEEASLFPRLTARISSRDPLRKVLAELAEDHVACRALQQDALALGRRALAGQADKGTLKALVDVATALSQRYTAHLERAGEVVLPRARELLEAKDLEAIGQEMARRRGNHEALGARTAPTQQSGTPGVLSS